MDQRNPWQWGVPMDQMGIPKPPTTGPQGDPLVVTATVDPGNPLRWHFKTEGGEAPVTFDFGDGTTHIPSDGRNTAHTYAAPGGYHVEVDDIGEGHAEVDIAVEGETGTKKKSRQG
jgi:hypothetical protein